MISQVIIRSHVGTITGRYRTTAGESQLLVKLPIILVLANGQELEKEVSIWTDEQGTALLDEIPEAQFGLLGCEVAMAMLGLI